MGTVGRIAIVGPGALGSALGLGARQRGATLSYLGRGGPVAWRASVAAGGLVEELHVPAASEKELRECRLVLVAVRAGDVAAALEMVAAVLPAVPVIPMGNGAVEDVVRDAAARHPDRPWRIGYSTLGVSQEGERRYAIRSTRGEACFGPLVPPVATPTPAEAELAGGPKDPGPFVWAPDAVQRVRRKWLFNVVINSLAAARRLRSNGELLADVPMLEAVFDEALGLVGRTYGKLPWSRDELWRVLLKLITDTTANENSMARDVRLGRPTEVDWLSGRATDAAAYPRLAELTRQIRATAKA